MTEEHTKRTPWENGQGGEGPVAGALRIFISYRHEDAPAHAGRLADRLVDRFGQDEVFMDIDSIDPGLDFRGVLKDAIDACDVLVVAIGRGWLGAVDSGGRHRLNDPDDYVRLEIEAALERNVRVIPVLLDGGYMPSADDLPSVLAPLCFRHAIDVGNKHFHGDVTDLIRTLEKVEEGKTGARQRPIPGALRPGVGPTTRLTGDFRFHLPIYETIVSCTDAIDRLGWPIDTVEANRVVAYANTDRAQHPPKIELQLSDSGGQSTDVRITGSVVGTAPHHKDRLVAELNRVRYAIEACIEEAKASTPRSPIGAPSKAHFDRKNLGLGLAALLVVAAAVTAVAVITSPGGGSPKAGGGGEMPSGEQGASQLQKLVPDFSDWNCVKGRPSTPAVEESAACTPQQGAGSVKFTLFKSMGAADAAYMKRVARADAISPTKIKPNSGRCTTQYWGGEVEWGHAKGVPAGRKLCYLTTSYDSNLVWTYVDAPLLVTAHRAGEAHGLLNSWFDSVAHDIGAGAGGAGAGEKMGMG